MKLLLTALLLCCLPWSAKAQVRLLSGPVDFFWQNATEPRTAHIPHTWGHEFGLPAFGWARYEMSLDLPPGEDLMLRLGPVSSSFRLLIDGVERAHCGSVGVDRQSTVAAYCAQVLVPLDKGMGKIKVTLEVANFTNYVGGWMSPLELGTPTVFAQREREAQSQGVFVLAVLFIMGFYHLIVYAFRRSDLSFRAYGFFCLNFLVFLSMADPSYPIALIRDLSYDTMVRLFNISFNLSVPLFMMYVQQLFPRYWFRGMISFTWAYVIAWCVVILVYRPDQFIPVAPAMQNFSLLSLFCTLLVAVQAHRDRLKGSGTFALSILFLVGAAALDMMRYREVLHLPPMLNHGLLGFTLCQAVLLARRYAEAFQTIELRVEEQTHDLREQNERLESLQRYINHNVLERYLPPDLVKDLVAGREVIDDKPRLRTITILFADLCDFTRSAEALGAERISAVLNAFLGRMTAVVFEEGGTIDKFIGDAVLVLFGAPKDSSPEEQVERAARCARAMQEALQELNASWESREGCSFAMRIGIHHGSAIVGSFGSSQRSDYTAIGPAVNVASRVEGCAKPGQILITPAVRQYLPASSWRELGSFKLRGLNDEMRLALLLTEDTMKAEAS